MQTQIISVEITEEQTQKLGRIFGADVEFSEYKIETSEQYQNAAEMLKRIKSDYKEVENMRVAITKPMDDAKKNVMDYFRPFIDRLAKAEAVIKNGIVGYQAEQNRIHAEAQRKAIEAARAEEERKRKALEAQAEKAEKKGHTDKAELLRDRSEAIHVPIQVVTSQVQKVSGIKTVETWKYEITDLNLVPREFLIVDEKKLGAYGRAMKSSANVAGVRFYQEQTIAAGVR
jgi:uncharacterized membrane-anchored protein YhcB (DUF1043 family)